jgi:small-conductance mechanosensitive channel
VRFKIPVGVAYRSDVVKVRVTLLAVADENPHTLKEPEPRVLLEQFGDSSIDFKLVVWSSEMSDHPSGCRGELNFAIGEKFREAGIQIPFPQRDVHLP